MKELERGHSYALYWLDIIGNPTHPGYEKVTFRKRSSDVVFYGNTEHNGTNTQEVIRALIARCEFLNNILPCAETVDAIDCLRTALFLFEVRAYRRKMQKQNKGKELHLEEDRLDAHRECYRDVPFTRQNIEHRPVGADGHILLTEEERKFK